jgi:hypothetical protein
VSDRVYKAKYLNTSFLPLVSFVSDTWIYNFPVLLHVWYNYLCVLSLSNISAAYRLCVTFDFSAMLALKRLGPLVLKSSPSNSDRGKEYKMRRSRYTEPRRGHTIIHFIHAPQIRNRKLLVCFNGAGSRIVQVNTTDSTRDAVLELLSSLKHT